ncbi:TonB-dependent receptor plug domain-containing protein [Rhodospirillum centenum]|uniref:TonB dependent receptor, putative n=1 Tax=Rhodospirillum centenum (strain ATCC 51521 / SW) TaxID=414684 RepID=B6IQN8_RHOCS|nr:TonB-dependent receptor [Rhodospirillum centenum]ACI97774.1 TonB dependent receptor, putative [Rhodospirillum centenum SW]
MRFRTSTALVALALTTAALPAGAQQGGVTAGQEALEEIIVTGTRGTQRTLYETLSPVDVISGDTIDSTVSSELVDSLAQTIPSFNVQRLPANDGLAFVRPARLRGLSPDQTLVLVNGKRRHRSALLGSRGSQGPDLAQIPSFAIKRIEVLRDGAAAQYGSDAIAGVINIILDDQPGYRFFTQASQYYEGDGENYQFGAQGGWEIGNGGFLTATAEWSDQNATSRTRQRPDAIAFQAANPNLSVPNPVQRWGQPDLETVRLAVNGELPLGESVQAYLFGTYGEGDGWTDFNWRNPDSTSNVYKTTPIFPGWDARSLYPTGFTPRFGQEDQDYSIVGGVRGDVTDDLTWDLSGSYGRNRIDYKMRETINASLGPDSPTSFDDGSLIQEEFNLNLDFVYSLHTGLLEAPVNVAFGGERREETYKIVAGDEASWVVGPGASAGLATGSNGFPGYGDAQAGSFDQESYAGYVDVEVPVTDIWTIGLAGRYEDFSEFGSTTDGKISTRVEVLPNLALRGSASTGFRAPTPGQAYSTRTSQGLDTVTLNTFTSGRLEPSNPVAQYFGAKPLKPEESVNLSAGLAFQTDTGFSATVDVYQIKVTDRFSQSSSFTVTDTIRQQLIAQGVPGANTFTSVSFFTNDFDTRTRGIDIVGSYATDAGPGHLTLSAAYNYNKTEVTGGSLASNPTQALLFEEGLPQHNATLSADYRLGPVNLMARLRYYGEWTDSSGNATGDIFQTFGAESFVDMAVTWDITDAFSLRVGAENVFDNYPGEATYQSNRGLIYSRNAPYDTDGGQYYVRLDVRY